MCILSSRPRRVVKCISDCLAASSVNTQHARPIGELAGSSALQPSLVEAPREAIRSKNGRPGWRSRWTRPTRNLDFLSIVTYPVGMNRVLPYRR
jgi:hypothetical protein